MTNVSSFQWLALWSFVRCQPRADTEFEPRATSLQSQTGLAFLRQNKQVYRCGPINHVTHSPKYDHLQSPLMLVQRFPSTQIASPIDNHTALPHVPPTPLRHRDRDIDFHPNDTHTHTRARARIDTCLDTGRLHKYTIPRSPPHPRPSAPLRACQTAPQGPMSAERSGHSQKALRTSRTHTFLGRAPLSGAQLAGGHGPGRSLP